MRERYEALAVDPGGDFNFRVGREFAEALGYHVGHRVDTEEGAAGAAVSKGAGGGQIAGAEMGPCQQPAQTPMHQR